jgi:integrase
VQPWVNVRRDLAAACRRAGIERVTPNDLRRTFASGMKQGGEDSAVVA